jgi:hypothetical protein
MKKTWFASSLVLFFAAGDVAFAAANDVSNTTWNLVGKFSFTPTVSCAKGGGANPGKKDVKLNLKPTIAFNADKSFTLSGDALTTGFGANGTWSQKGGKLDLDFASQYNSALATMLDTLKKAWEGTSSAGGATANWKWSNPKYSFSGTVNGKGTVLKVNESTSIKLTAKASYGGFSNTCTYNFKWNRSYTGTKAK